MTEYRWCEMKSFDKKAHFSTSRCHMNRSIVYVYTKRTLQYDFLSLKNHLYNRFSDWEKNETFLQFFVLIDYYQNGLKKSNVC